MNTLAPGKWAKVRYRSFQFRTYSANGTSTLGKSRWDTSKNTKYSIDCECKIPQVVRADLRGGARAECYACSSKIRPGLWFDRRVYGLKPMYRTSRAGNPRLRKRRATSRPGLQRTVRHNLPGEGKDHAVRSMGSLNWITC
jgi:hypothetical protein